MYNLDHNTFILMVFVVICCVWKAITCKSTNLSNIIDLHKLSTNTKWADSILHSSPTQFIKNSILSYSAELFNRNKESRKIIHSQVIFLPFSWFFFQDFDFRKNQQNIIYSIIITFVPLPPPMQTDNNRVDKIYPFPQKFFFSFPFVCTFS